jgi:hypothetical protein
MTQYGSVRLVFPRIRDNRRFKEFNIERLSFAVDFSQRMNGKYDIWALAQ